MHVDFLSCKKCKKNNGEELAKSIEPCKRSQLFKSHLGIRGPKSKISEHRHVKFYLTSNQTFSNSKLCFTFFTNGICSR